MEYLVPGLLAAVSLNPELVPKGRFPVLERFLSQACYTSSGSTLTRHLFEILEIHCESGKDYPTAAVKVHAQWPDTDPESVWIEATPVRLEPDRDRLLVYPAMVDQLDDSLTGRLAEKIQGYFCDDFKQIRISPEGDWLIQLSQQPSIRTFLPEQVIGRGMQQFLPTGDDAAYWISLANELQMFLYSQDLPSVTFNAFWFHGAGSLPSVAETGNKVVLSDNALARALAEIKGCRQVTADGLTSLEDHDALLMIDERVERAVRMQDSESWFRAMSVVDAELDKLQLHLKQKKIREIVLHDCEGRSFRLKNRDRLKFWKRHKKLADMI